MLPWYLMLAGLSAGAALVAWSYWPRKAPLREAVIPSSIAELECGRFRVTGRIVPIRVEPSAIDGRRCVYVERARYERSGNSFASVLREVDHEWHAHSFYLDDGTGRVLVDPTQTLIDCEPHREETGAVVERRLCEGEEVELVATFRLAEEERQELEGPYRTPPCRFEPDAHSPVPPQLCARAESPSVKRADLPRAFARSVGLVIVGLTVLSSLVPSAPPLSHDRVALGAAVIEASLSDAEL